MDRSIKELLTAREATALLGIKRDTLYAYVSRGLVRSVAGEGGRERRYFKSDVERLKTRHDARAGHGAVAGAALRFGEPVLDSAITRIDPERGPVYRGQAAVELAEREVPFEAVASHLVSGPLEATRFEGEPIAKRALAAVEERTPLPRLLALVPLLALRDPARFSATAAADVARSRVLMAQMAASLGDDRARTERALGAPSIARALAIALGARQREAAAALDRALVLCADHELNPSTFAARIAASAGADLHACISAALATLSGPRHGGACDRVEALLSEVSDAARASTIVRERARRGEAIPGFGHPLYPKGDPRAAPLLDVARALAPKNERVRAAVAMVRAMRDEGREAPTLDLGLVAVASALELPAGTAVALFAIGRTAGWVAHVLEQRTSDWVLRPRARYVGV